MISESKIVASKDTLGRVKKDKLAPLLLESCLANEIQISPDLLKTAIEWYAKNTYLIRDRGNTEIILKNKFGSAFKKTVKERFFEKYDDKYSSPLGSTLSDIFLSDLKNSDNKTKIPNEILAGLKKETKEDKCIAILGMMGYVFGISRSHKAEIPVSFF